MRISLSMCMEYLETCTPRIAATVRKKGGKNEAAVWREKVKLSLYVRHVSCNRAWGKVYIGLKQYRRVELGIR